MRPCSPLAVIAALGWGLVLGAPPASAAFAFRPDQAAAKLTATAKRLKAPYSFQHRICTTTDMTGCAFLVGSLAGVATGPAQGKADRVDLMFSPGDGEPIEVPITWGILMALVSPEMAPNDRGALTVKFMRAFAEPGFTTLSERRGAVTYTVSLDREFGLHFVAEADAP